MGRISEDSLEFARRHIREFYDSDFFPKPFEFDAIWHCWEEAKAHLMSLELADYRVSQPRAMAAPKPEGGFRVVHQLEPLDSLIYTALAHTIAERIEAARIPPDRHVVFSYRVAIDGGNFFAAGNGYAEFLDTCENLSGAYSHVLVADISDFYNQIALHRLRNAIGYSDPRLEEVAGDIERFLLALNDTNSKGIPVGPAASIVMAEACLIDVDQYLEGRGYSHVRYVDDIRIFGDSEPALSKLQEGLTMYLYQHHRLTLSASKTKIMSTEEFVSEFLLSPEVLEKAEIHEALGGFSMESPYGSIVSRDIEDLSPEERVRIRADVFLGLMERILAFGFLDLGLARHILRRCRRLRIRAIAEPLVEHLNLFAPVVSDVVLYLESITNDTFISQYSDRLGRAAHSLQCMDVPLVRYWFERYFSRYPQYCSHRDINAFLFSGNIENQARAAVALRDIAWFRTFRGDLATHASWEQRAIIYAAQLASRDERQHWFQHLERTLSDQTARFVVRWLRSR